MARSVHRALTVNHADHETQTGLTAQNSVLSSKKTLDGITQKDSGCEYYLFVQRFTSLDDLRLKDALTGADKIRAFVEACRQETFGGPHKLAYVGTYPLASHEFLDVLFGTQAAVRPKDAFGFDGMRRQALALAPPARFKLDAFLLDPSLQPAVRKLNAVIREFETFR